MKDLYISYIEHIQYPATPIRLLCVASVQTDNQSFIRPLVHWGLQRASSITISITNGNEDPRSPASLHSGSTAYALSLPAISTDRTVQDRTADLYCGIFHIYSNERHATSVTLPTYVS